jgi:hypothetical protein
MRSGYTLMKAGDEATAWKAAVRNNTFRERYRFKERNGRWGWSSLERLARTEMPSGCSQAIPLHRRVVLTRRCIGAVHDVQRHQCIYDSQHTLKSGPRSLCYGN